MRGKIVTAFIFLTMMTGAVSAAPVLDYTGAERLEEARQREADRQERLRMPRVENMGSSLNEKEEMQGAAGPVFRIDEIILSGQEEKFGWLQDIIQPHIHTDMGISSVNRLVKDLNAKLLDKGYVTSRIVQAIYHHVKGRNRTDFDRILFIADKLDPSRGYDSRREIEISRKSLREGYRVVKQQQEAYLKKEGTLK